MSHLSLTTLKVVNRKSEFTSLFIFQAIPPMAHEINNWDTDILQYDPEAYGPEMNESETDGLL